MANNEYVNKVQFGSTTVMDITDTTAESNDVLDGEVFYTASGSRSVGTLGDATQSTHGLMSITDKVKLDGITAGANKPVFLTYGSSTWNDAITAYNNGAQLYCLASTSMDTPGSGTMSRIAQLVYVAIGSGETVPYQFEFQYFRSIANKTTSLLSDQVLVYKLDQNEGWSFSYRYVSIGEVSTSNGITASYNSNTLSLSGPSIMTGATSVAAGSSGLVPVPNIGDQNKYLKGDGTWDNSSTVLTYGVSTWNDFITAYNANKAIYCVVGSGNDFRIATFNFINTGTHEAEFQYYRSLDTTTSNDARDQVIIYKLSNNNTWTTTTRPIYIINATSTTSGLMSSSDKSTFDQLFTSGLLSLSSNTELHVNTTAKFMGDIYVNCDGSYENGAKVATQGYVNAAIANISVEGGGGVSVPMTGATASTDGTAGLVPQPLSTDLGCFLSADGTWKAGGRPMVILSYGSSTWADFEAAYNNNVIVYCRASSQTNPATGSQTRMAFMAYVNDASSPTNVEFQYYRSVSSHSSTQMGDQVFVYKLDKTNGWSVTTREASIKEIKAGTSGNISVSWSSNKVTINGGLPAVTASDNGKILQVVNGAWALVTPS